LMPTRVLIFSCSRSPSRWNSDTDSTPSVALLFTATRARGAAGLPPHRTVVLVEQTEDGADLDLGVLLAALRGVRARGQGQRQRWRRAETGGALRRGALMKRNSMAKVSNVMAEASWIDSICAATRAR
jgi:hypothetical protein